MPNMVSDDALCIGHGRVVCSKCARHAPGKKTGKHLPFRPSGTDKKCEMYKAVKK